MGTGDKKRIGILVVAYNAASTLAKVLDRIPEEIRPDIEEVIVSDDHSQDSTYLVGLGYQQVSDLPITLIRQPANLGYGGNQKAGYDVAIEHGLDIVVMLHGDGQYAPESLPDILAPLIAGEADAVFGSRIMVKGAARKGGNAPLQVRREPHPLPIRERDARNRSVRIPFAGIAPTRSTRSSRSPSSSTPTASTSTPRSSSSCTTPGCASRRCPFRPTTATRSVTSTASAYAADVTKDVVAYRLQKAGFGDGSRIALKEEYELKPSEDSSHGRISAMLSSKPPSKILDLGCSSGLLAERLRAMGHHVTGVDVTEIEGVGERTSAFFKADLNEGIPSEVGSDFDIVLAADVLEHLADPAPLMDQIRDVLAPEGTAIFCVPNVAHWYPRFRVTLGVFDYDQRGILDATHLRFFTRRSIKKFVERQGFTIRRIEPVGLPLDALGLQGVSSKVVRLVDQVVLSLWPTLFGYQFIIEASPAGRSAT